MGLSSATSVWLLFMFALRSPIPSEESPIAQDDRDVCNTPVCQEAAQVLLNFMDLTADPCNDFYRYACGGWIDKHPVPGEKTSYHVMTEMEEDINAKIAELLVDAENEDHIKPIADASTLYRSCLNEDARQTEGLEPLKTLLNSLGGWPMADPEWSASGFRWQDAVATTQRTLDVSSIVSVGVTEDTEDSSQYMIGLSDSTFGIDREELLNEEASSELKAYKYYIMRTGKLLNPTAGKAQLIRDAGDIIRFETNLAQLSRPDEEKRDPTTLFTRMRVSELDNATENTSFRWLDFLNNIFQDFPEVTGETEILVAEREYIKNALKLIEITDPRTVANYVGWILLKEIGDQTTREFRQNSFTFLRSQSGVSRPEALNTTCVELTIQQFKFAVTRLYLDKYAAGFFDNQARQDVEEILEDIRSTYELTLNHNTWLDPETKDKALEKLRSMIEMIAYPEWIKDDQELIEHYHSVPDLKEDEFFTSLMKVMGALAAMELKKWNQPTNKTHWDSTPTEVNAYYDPSANTIMFPFGILHEPYYKYGRPLALNYGSLGGTIGHEISHGFDDRGSKYDKDGNLLNWWSDETAELFDNKANCFRKQYSSYVEPLTNTPLNGNMTIGDDIADNGGLRNAFLAYKMRVLDSDSQETVAKERLPLIPATPEQLFFLGFASTFCWNEKEDYLAYSIENGDHTIESYRVIVSLSNSRDFSRAYNCPPGSPMNPEAKCVLW